MFHVSTMLPYNPGDPQQLERKRHLGNNVVMLVFKEGQQKFDPTCIRSDFNHVFLVVQRWPSHDKQEYSVTIPAYRLEICCKGDTPNPTLPVLPVQPIFHLDETFHRFLLTKSNFFAFFSTSFIFLVKLIVIFSD